VPLPIREPRERQPSLTSAFGALKMTKGSFKRKRAVRALILSALIAIAFYLMLYLSTERWRVYGNDILPHFDWWSLQDLHTWLMLALWLFPVAAITLGVVILAKRAGHWRWVALVLVLPALFFSRGVVIRSRLKNCIASCANHSSFWGSWDFKGDTVLTNSVEFDDFLIQMHGPEKDSASRYCPGWRRAGTKTGVVFIGGGLDLGAMRTADVLIAFCSRKCHPAPYDHQHCLVWQWGNVNDEYRGMFHRECTETADMIARLRTALQQSESGTVPYSKEAVGILRYELSSREAIQKEHPTTPRTASVAARRTQ
jgi:hypothetical protein